jgi:hypothetical protein
VKMISLSLITERLNKREFDGKNKIKIRPKI